MFVDPICTTLSKTKVKCKGDQPSLSGDGSLVVVSDRIDELIGDEDTLKNAVFPFLVSKEDEILKTLDEEQQEQLQSGMEKDLDGNLQRRVMSWVSKTPTPGAAEGSGAMDRTPVKAIDLFNKETGEYVSEFYSSDLLAVK